MAWRRRKQESSDALEETQVWRPAESDALENAFDDRLPTRSDYQANQRVDENQESNNLSNSSDDSEPVTIQRRAQYHARMDRFLTNGIIIVGVLLICVLLIAFLV